jgi:hypothetical protein
MTRRKHLPKGPFYRMCPPPRCLFAPSTVKKPMSKERWNWERLDTSAIEFGKDTNFSLSFDHGIEYFISSQ